MLKINDLANFITIFPILLVVAMQEVHSFHDLTAIIADIVTDDTGSSGLYCICKILALTITRQLSFYGLKLRNKLFLLYIGPIEMVNE